MSKLHVRSQLNLKRVSAVGIVIGAVAFLLMIGLRSFLSQYVLPFYLTVILFSVVVSPFIILFLYILFNALTRETGEFEGRGFIKWVLFYPLFIGFAAFWGLLSVLLEYSFPFLAAEDRNIYIPIWIVATLSVIVFRTRLRHPVERFLLKTFGGRSPNKSNQDE